MGVRSLGHRLNYVAVCRLLLSIYSMDVLEKLAEFAVRVSPADLPDRVRARTALILADTIGAIVGGAAEPEVQSLSRRLAGKGTVPLLGTNRRYTPGTAALLNGTAGTSLEMDEAHQYCKNHPAIHTIPAVLSAAVDQDPTGCDLLTAITIAYEVGARIGIATDLRPAMHTHGSWGTICAAVAVARLSNASAASMLDAINMAASLGLATSRRTMLEGGTVRNTFAGVSSQLGVLVGDLLASGYTGDQSGVIEVFGRVVSDTFDTDALIANLGERWEVERNYFKAHACCGYNHAAINALNRVRADTSDLDLKSIRSIDVETYALAVELSDPAPKNVLASKFSVPFALATTLWNGDAGVESFTSGTIANHDILDLAAKVRLKEDESMTASLPDRRPARVTLRLADGTSREAEVDMRENDAPRQPSTADLRQKYLSLTTRLWREDAAEAIWDSIMAIDSAPSTASLFAAMASATRQYE